MENKYTPAIQAEPEVREMCDNILALAEEKWGHVLDPQPPVEIGAKVRTNWACAWNSPRNVGKEGRIVATNGRFCILAMNPVVDPPSNIYRCEDLTIL